MTAEFELSLVTSITALIFALIAVLQTRRAQRFQEELSRVQGSFSKVDINAAFFGRSDAQTVLIMAPLEPSCILETPLFIDLNNDGDKTAREVEIAVFVPKPLSYDDAADATFTSGSPKFTAQPMIKGTWRNEMRIRGESLHPKQGLALRLPISLAQGTRFPASVPATTADGVQLTVNLNVTLSYRVEIFFLQADKPAKFWSYNIEFLNTLGSTPQEVLAKHYEVVEASGSYKLKAMPRTLLVLPLSSSELVRDTKLPIVRPIDPQGLHVYPALQWKTSSAYQVSQGRWWTIRRRSVRSWAHNTPIERTANSAAAHRQSR